MSDAAASQNQPASPAAPPPYFAVALAAGTSLALEVLLIRLFSIVQWHHFAYLVISLALLGVGASGTLAALFRDWFVQHVRSVLPAVLLAFGVSVWLGFQLAQRVPFNVEELFWDWGQLPLLASVYALLVVPFFLSGLAVCLSLAAWPGRIARLYATDLAGAGVGALGIMLLLTVTSPAGALAWLAATGLLACLVSVRTLGPRYGRWIVAACLASLAAIALAPSALVISPYKPLEQILQIAGTRIVETANGPLGTVHVVESRDIPLRHAPGMSLMSRSELPDQFAVFVDADAMSALVRFDGDRTTLAYLDYLTSAAPYHLAKPGRVAILGAGAGSGVLQAVYHQVPAIDAVEINPDIVGLMTGPFADVSGGMYARDDIHIHVADARGFIATTAHRFDLVQLELVDSYAGSAGGLRSLSESYLYTVEALNLFLDRLEPGGYLAITRWVQVPPRELPKLVATAAQALAERSVHDAGARMLLLRGLQTGTLLIKNGEVTPEEIAALKRFCEQRAFDIAWYPGMAADEANRFNMLAEPYFHDAAAALLGGQAAEYLANYKFDLSPATDNRPYFGHFMKWSSFPEIWGARARGGMAMVEWGYVVLLASLAQAVLMSVVLIALPLAGRAHGRTSPVSMRLKVLAYFCAIGLGFLFIEIAVLQKLILLLHHPLHASVATLSAFLVFAGLGSMVAETFTRNRRHRTAVWFAVAGIWLVGIGFLAGFDGLVASLSGWPPAARIAAAVAVIAPLALCMGIPFATAMDALAKDYPKLVPWAWAVNGCASVLSAVLAALLAVHVGFDRVIAAALVLYAVAALSLPLARRRSDAVAR